MHNPKWIKHFKADKKSKIINAYNDVFNSDDGQVILKDLANYCCFNHSSFISQDSHLTAFNEGARDAFLHILELTNINPQSLLKADEE